MYNCIYWNILKWQSVYLKIATKSKYILSVDNQY